MKKIVYLLISLSLVLSVNAFAQGNLAQSGANFLQIAAEPRGAALGGAVSAITEGAEALYWNPAGIMSTTNVDVVLSQTDWFIDTQMTYAGVVKRLDGSSAVGLSFTSFYMDDLEITTVYESEGTGETFSAGDLAIGLSYARVMTDHFTFGITGKFVQENIWDVSASQVAVDIGSKYTTDFYNLCLGIAIRNIAGKLEMSGDNIDDRLDYLNGINTDNDPRLERLTPEYRLPQIFQLGIAFQPVQMSTSELNILADVDVPSDNEERLSLGLEYGYNDLLFLRGSMRVNDDTGEFNLGAGFNVKVSSFQTRLNYSFSSYEYLDQVHRFGLGFSM